MDPRLVAINGPLKGQVISVTADPVSIGREAASTLVIDDDSVSRRHCLIRSDRGRYSIRDLDSTNGTFVNGLPVRSRVLEHADRIAVGGTVFLFLLKEPEPAPRALSIQVESSHSALRSTVQIRPEDAIYLQQEKILALHPDSRQVGLNLYTLLKFSSTINSIRDLELLKLRLLEFACEIVPAGRAAIVLAENGPQDPVVFAGDRASRRNEPFKINSSIVTQVVRERISILSNAGPDVEKSRPDSDRRSVICAPLSLFERALGVLYLESDISFEEDHLHLITAVARIAALAIENASHVEWLEIQNRRLQEEISVQHSMIGESAAMRSILRFITKVAPVDSTVLIRGESGTGKELVANAIHRNSPRAARPFLAINCATLNEPLAESELFGHERGAFTGAVTQHKGKLEIAGGGTVFLDEVAELSLPLQAKLLRVLQMRKFERVGGTSTLTANIRVLAATNRDLEEAIKKGSFRSDLYFRLNVVSLTVPPLRARRDDIPLLISYFTRECAKRAKRPIDGISPEARAHLMEYDWPGNVRELENAIERAVVLGSSRIIEAEDLPETLLEASPAVGSTTAGYHSAVKECKKRLILKTMGETGGNYTEAARLLGLHPNHLHRLIRNMNLKADLKK
jgi:two-component system, NtrC family, response regulator HydG